MEQRKLQKCEGSEGNKNIKNWIVETGYSNIQIL
jgi:hypothetical protein